MRGTTYQKNSEYEHFSRTEVHATSMLTFDAYVDRYGATFTYFLFQKFARILSLKRGTYDLIGIK